MSFKTLTRTGIAGLIAQPGLFRLKPAIALFAIVAAAAAAGPLSAQDLVLVGARVVDVRTGASTASAVLVRNGIVQRVEPGLVPPPDATILDVSGRWIVPGIVELHSHTTDSVALRRALGLGVTTVLTVYTGDEVIPPSTWENISHLPDHPGPRNYLIGGRFRVPFRIGTQAALNATTLAEVGDALDGYRSQGVTRIKIWLDDGSVQFDSLSPTFDDLIFQALIDGAHARDMEVYVHAISGELYRRAVAAGPSWIIHPMVSDSLTPSDVAAIREAGLGYTSVMSIVEWNTDPRRYARRALTDPRIVAGMTDERLERYRRDAALAENPNAATRPRIVRRGDDYLRMIANGLQLVVESDLTLAVGSDIGAGFGTHVEMELLQEAGLAPQSILRAATVGGAVALGVADRFGLVEPGMIADLVVVKSNPLEDVKNMRDVEYVVKGGHVWSAADLMSP